MRSLRYRVRNGLRSAKFGLAILVPDTGYASASLHRCGEVVWVWPVCFMNSSMKQNSKPFFSFDRWSHAVILMLRSRSFDAFSSPVSGRSLDELSVASELLCERSVEQLTSSLSPSKCFGYLHMFTKWAMYTIHQISFLTPEFSTFMITWMNEWMKESAMILSAFENRLRVGLV